MTPDRSKIAHQRIAGACDLLALAANDLDAAQLPATADEVERLRAHLAGVCNALNPDRSLTAHGGT